MYGFNERATQLIHELYEFTRCERKDGSTYGTGGKCRIGVEAAKEEIMKVPLTSAEAEVGEEARDSIYKMYGLDKDKAKEFYKLVKAEKEQILQEMDKKTVERSEIEDYVKSHAGKGDFMTAKVITVGMEEPLPPNPKGHQVDASMAVRLAQERVMKSLGLDHIPKELVIASEVQAPGEPINEVAKGNKLNGGILGQSFWRNQANYLREAGENIEKDSLYRLYSSKNHAGLEIGAIPAAGIKVWPVGDRPWVKDKPAVWQVIGSRQNAQSYTRDRMKTVLGQLDKAVKGNPNLTTILFAPGKNAPVASEVFKHFEKSGGRIYEKEMWVNDNEKTLTRIAVMKGKGPDKVLIDPGVSVSHQSVTKEFKDDVGSFIRSVKTGKVEPTGFHESPLRGGGAPPPKAVNRVQKKEEKPIAKPKPPIEGARATLDALRKTGMPDSEIRRTFPNINKFWDQIK